MIVSSLLSNADDVHPQDNKNQTQIKPIIEMDNLSA